MQTSDDILNMRQLQSAKSLVATEALSVYRPLAGTVEKLCGYLGDVSNTISFSLAQLKDQVIGTNTAMLTFDNQLSDKVAASKYTDLMSIMLPCIPGQTGTWLQVLDAFELPVSMAVNLNDNILIPYEKYISQAIVDPERFSSATNKASVEIVDFSKIREGFNDTIGGNRHVAQRKYRELAERNGDVVTATHRTREYQVQLAKTNPRMVADRINDLRGLTTQLSENLNDSNQKFRLSGKTIANISEAAYNIAEAIELYSATMTFFHSHVEAFNAAQQKLYRAM